jgi:hypothetical protein
MIWILLLALLCAACGDRRATVARSSPAIASPAPTSTKCWIDGQIYPATQAAYASQHITMAERAEIKKWSALASPSQVRLVKSVSPMATPPTASEEHLVRWMRGGGNRWIYVFVARPLFTQGETGHSPWVGLNANVIIDPVTCDVGAYRRA